MDFILATPVFPWTIAAPGSLTFSAVACFAIFGKLIAGMLTASKRLSRSPMAPLSRYYPAESEASAMFSSETATSRPGEAPTPRPRDCRPMDCSRGCDGWKGCVLPSALGVSMKLCVSLWERLPISGRLFLSDLAEIEPLLACRLFGVRLKQPLSFSPRFAA